MIQTSHVFLLHQETVYIGEIGGQCPHFPALASPRVTLLKEKGVQQNQYIILHTKRD